MAVCLHCLHDARLAARERRQRAILRFGAWMVTLSVIGVVGMAGVNAARHPSPAPAPAKRVASKPAVPAPTPVAAATPVVQQGAPAEVLPPVTDTTAHSVAGANNAPSSVATVAAAGTIAAPAAVDSSIHATARLGPIVGHGRTDLADSLFATRSGDTVVVHFDTSPARTRRADKFESVVRQTLKAVYGPIADSVLATVPTGKLVAPNELLTTLPSRGIHLAGPHGVRIVLWPETRAGRDGPLAVAYRAVVER
jgi:hypothetical protein